MKKQLISMMLIYGLLLTALPITQMTVSARGETPDMPTMNQLMAILRENNQQTNTNAYDAVVNFQNDYGNNISEGIEQGEGEWDDIKSIRGFESSLGGAGLSDDDFKNSIKEGITKINIFTDLCAAGEAAVKQAIAENKGYLEMRNAKVNAVKEAVKKKMKLFGSENKA